MKTQPINNINFKALYVKNMDYNDPQRYALQNIQNGLDEESIAEIAAKGYDVFIENNPDNKHEVSVSAIKNFFNFTDESAVKECRRIPIGNYGAEELCSEFNVKDIHSEIDSFESNLKKANNFAKVIIGALLLGGLTLLSIAVSKTSRTAAPSNVQKAKTEVVQTIYKIK